MEERRGKGHGRAMPDRVVYTSRWTMGGAVATFLLFVLISLWMLGDAARQDGADRVVERTFGVVSLLFFGGFLVLALRRLVSSQPALILTSDGLNDHSSLAAVGFTAWSEIVGLSEHRVSLQRFLGLWVRYPEAILRRQPGWRRRLIRANMALGFAPICLSTVGLEISLEELYEEVEARLRTGGGMSWD